MDDLDDDYLEELSSRQATTTPQKRALDAQDELDDSPRSAGSFALPPSPRLPALEEANAPPSDDLDSPAASMHSDEPPEAFFPFPGFDVADYDLRANEQDEEAEGQLEIKGSEGSEGAPATANEDVEALEYRTEQLGSGDESSDEEQGEDKDVDFDPASRPEVPRNVADEVFPHDGLEFSFLNDIAEFNFVTETGFDPNGDPNVVEFVPEYDLAEGFVEVENNMTEENVRMAYKEGLRPAEVSQDIIVDLEQIGAMSNDEADVVDALFSYVNEVKTKARNDFVPPEDSRPNRDQPNVPDLNADPLHEDAVLDPVTSRPTLTSVLEPDPAVRFSSAYISSLPKESALLYLAPHSFDVSRRFTFQTHFNFAYVSMNSVQSKCLLTYTSLDVRWFRWAEIEGIPPEQRFPARASDVYRWLADAGSVYSVSYVQKHKNALEFLHQIHGISLALDSKIVHRIFRGTRTVSKAPLKKRRGLTVMDLEALNRGYWNEALEDESLLPRSLAFMACNSLTFFGICRSKDTTSPRQNDQRPITKKKAAPGSKKNKKIGSSSSTQNKDVDSTKDASASATLPASSSSAAKQKTVKRPQLLKAFDSRFDLSGASFSFRSRRHNDDGTYGNPQLVIAKLPWDKVKKSEGRKIYVPAQEVLGDFVNPVSLLQAHLAANQPTKDDPAFSFIGRNGKSRIKLTRSFFMKKNNEVITAAGRHRFSGHSYRIGATSFYKFAGVSSSQIMDQGSWASAESFKRYQRDIGRATVKFSSNLPAPDGDDGDDDESDDDLPVDVAEPTGSAIVEDDDGEWLGEDEIGDDDFRDDDE